MDVVGNVTIHLQNEHRKSKLVSPAAAVRRRIHTRGFPPPHVGGSYQPKNKNARVPNKRGRKLLTMETGYFCLTASILETVRTFLPSFSERTPVAVIFSDFLQILSWKSLLLSFSAR